jgi:hypothetical protein
MGNVAEELLEGGDPDRREHLVAVPLRQRQITHGFFPSEAMELTLIAENAQHFSSTSRLGDDLFVGVDVEQ